MKRITFFVGPNGCGKTRKLVMSAKDKIARHQSAAAIANTPFIRFPRSRDRFKVFRINPNGINRIVKDNLASLYEGDRRGTFDASELLKTIGFHPKIELEIELNPYHDGILYGLDANLYEIEAIDSALEILRSLDGQSRFDVSNSSDSFSRSLQERSGILFKYIKLLKATGVVTNYGLVFHHLDRGTQFFEELSSGEQTLISSHLFIKANAKKVQTLFIDEPENSLHPEWQRRYVEMLHMALSYSDVKIILATHSPVLVSGALSNYGQEVEVIKIDGNRQSIVDIHHDSGPDSVEEILWEAFDTITPVSHFLSIELANILQKLTDGEMSREEAGLQIGEFRKKSYDSKQQELLGSVLERLSGFAKDA